MWDDDQPSDKGPDKRPLKRNPKLPEFLRNEEFAAWFGKSQVVDKKGQPLRVYRGEHGKTVRRRFHSRLGSISFGTCETANHYADSPNNSKDVVHSPRVTAAYVRIEKPFVVQTDDPFISLVHIRKKLGMEEALRVARKFAASIENTNNWEDVSEATGFTSVKKLLAAKPKMVDELYFDLYEYLDGIEEVTALKKAGYDGAIHIGSGDTYDAMEYKVFDVSQVRSAITPWLEMAAVVQHLVDDGTDLPAAEKAVTAMAREHAARTPSGPFGHPVRIYRQHGAAFVRIEDFDAAVDLAREHMPSISPSM